MAADTPSAAPVLHSTLLRHLVLLYSVIVPFGIVIHHFIVPFGYSYTLFDDTITFLETSVQIRQTHEHDQTKHAKQLFAVVFQICAC